MPKGWGKLNSDPGKLVNGRFLLIRSSLPSLI